MVRVLILVQNGHHCFGQSGTVFRCGRRNLQHLQREYRGVPNASSGSFSLQYVSSPIDTAVCPQQPLANQLTGETLAHGKSLVGAKKKKSQ